VNAAAPVWELYCQTFELDYMYIMMAIDIIFRILLSVFKRI
jgi:hypothetical protein